MWTRFALSTITAVLLAPLATAASIYLGTFAGNDSETAVEAAILAATGVSVDIGLYDKSDEAPILTTFSPVPSGSELSGTWDVLDDAVLISYLTVKASDFFALYQYIPPANSGSWSTADIVNGGDEQPGASHISLWTTTEIPEPNTFGLIGFALVGAGILRRRATA